MNELVVELLMSENKALRDEIIRLKARLYDKEHPETANSCAGIDWEMFLKGGRNNGERDELVDGIGTAGSDYTL